MPREIRKREPDSREDELFEIRREFLERQVWQGDGNEDFYDEEDEGYEGGDGEDIDDDDEYVDDDEYEDDEEEDDGI